MAWKMILVFVLAHALLLHSNGAMAGVIGMNWGRMNVQKLVPSMVVDLLLQNNITAARVFTAQDDILDAFSGSQIHLTIGIFKPYQINTTQAAQKWVDARQKFFEMSNVRRIILGSSEIRPVAAANLSQLMDSVRAIGYLQEALNQRNWGDKIKAVIEISQNALVSNFTKPSEADFHESLKNILVEAIKFLRQSKAPLMIEVFPISFVTENLGFIMETLANKQEFAFIGGNSSIRITDVNGIVYTNSIDFILDSYVSALEKLGGGDIPLIISSIGWPTDGYPGANAANAERFFKTFLPWAASNRGTPRRPGPWDVYVHSISDENKRSSTLSFSRHWGIYTTYGEPKYKIDLQGLGRDIYPTRATGIMRMPKRWCVLDERYLSNTEMVDYYYAKACQHADCTSLVPGGSCSELTYAQNVSYAFNMFFQSKFQQEIACNMYLHVGKVVTDNPSVGKCIFPVEVVKPWDGYHLYHKSGGLMQNRVSKYVLSSMLFLSLFWVLLWN